MFNGFIKFMTHHDKDSVKVGDGEVKIYKSSEKNPNVVRVNPQFVTDYVKNMVVNS